jgi:hypothetical protein
MRRREGFGVSKLDPEGSCDISSFSSLAQAARRERTLTEGLVRWYESLTSGSV